MGTLLVLASIVVILAGMKFASSLLVPFLLAVFIATIASTPIGWLTRHKVPTWLAVTLVLVVLILIVMGLGMVIMQTVREFQAEQSTYVETIRNTTMSILQGLRDRGLDISGEQLLGIFDPSQAINFAGVALRSIGQVLSNAFLILLTVIFILAEITEWPRKLSAELAHRKIGFDWLTHFGSTLNRYIAIKTTTSLATGLLVTALLTLMGVDFAVLWGLLAFLLNFIPNIGSFIAATPAVLISLVQLGWGSALVVLIGYVVINVGIGAGIEPRFLGRTLGLSTLVVFLSLIFWGWIFGPVGMLLSVPLTMTAKIAFDSSESTAWIAHLLEPGVHSNHVDGKKEILSPKQEE